MRLDIFLWCLFAWAGTGTLLASLAVDFSSKLHGSRAPVNAVYWIRSALLGPLVIPVALWLAMRLVNSLSAPRAAVAVPVQFPELQDAQQMALFHPETFETLSEEEMRFIEPGDLVKVATPGPPGERFWVEVLDVGTIELWESYGELPITGRVDNELVFTKEHGLRLNDVISFKAKNAYNIEFSSRNEVP